MALNVSRAFLTANTILNQNLGKFDKMNLVGSNQNGELFYLVKDITRGFYYKGVSGGQGEIIETIRIVPENSTIDDALKNVVMIELVGLDGSMTRFTPKSKKVPERPSFQWEFAVKPNEQDTRVIT
jgi:hypothetical protein